MDNFGIKRDYKPVLIQILLAVLAMACAYFWWQSHLANRQQNEVGKTVIATQAKEVANVPKVDVKIKAPIKVYKGGASLKEGIKLPPEVVQDDAQQVIASSKIDGLDDHPKTVTTVIDTETGESQTYMRTDPLPWLAWSDRGSVGMYAGLKNGTPAVRLQAHQELFTVKAIHFGAVASVDQPISGPISADYFVGVGAEYRW